MRRLLAILLATLAACTVAPLPSPTPPPQATATALATIPATQEPPLYFVHPARVGLGTVDVLSTWCFSKTTAIAVYERSVEWHRDDAAYADCVSRGVLQ